MAVIYTATVSGKSYGFDFEDQRIDIDATVNNVLVTHLWTAIKEAQGSVEGVAYNRIASGSGKNTLGTGVETFLTVTLLDNWEVNTLKASGKFEVSGGNLIREDNADPFRDNPLITYIAFLSQAGIATQIETGVSGLTESESLQLSKLDGLFDPNTDTYEGSETYQDLMRLLRAFVAGNVADDGEGNAVLKSIDGLKDRITATYTNTGSRTVTATDKS